MTDLLFVCLQLDHPKPSQLGGEPSDGPPGRAAGRGLPPGILSCAHPGDEGPLLCLFTKPSGVGSETLRSSLTGVRTERASETATRKVPSGYEWKLGWFQGTDGGGAGGGTLPKTDRFYGSSRGYL